MFNLPLDLTGTLHENRLGYPVKLKGITDATMGEVIKVPYGVFHGNVTVIDDVTKNPLTENEDYSIGLVNQKVFRETGVEGYDYIVITNTGITNPLMVYANYFGGKYANLSNQDIPALIEIALVTKRGLSWDALEEAPTDRDPNDHAHGAESLVSGMQSITGRLWAAWKNKQSAGDSMIINAAGSVLKDFQEKTSTRLNTVDKAVVGAVNEVDGRSKLILGVGEEPLPYLGTLDNNDTASVSARGYYLIGDPLNGAPCSISAAWKDGSNYKTVDSGSIAAVVDDRLVDITAESGPYGLHSHIAGELFGRVFNNEDIINAIFDMVNPGVSGEEPYLSGYIDGTGLSKTKYILTGKDAVVYGRWSGQSWNSTRYIEPGKVVKMSPESGLDVVNYHPKRSTLGNLPLTSASLNTISKEPLKATKEIESKLSGAGFDTGDLIVVLQGGGLPAGEKAVSAGTTVTKAGNPRLYALIGDTFGATEDTFEAPPMPPLADVVGYVDTDGGSISVDGRYCWSPSGKFLLAVASTADAGVVLYKRDPSTRQLVGSPTTIYGPEVHDDNISYLPLNEDGTRLLRLTHVPDAPSGHAKVQRHIVFVTEDVVREIATSVNIETPEGVRMQHGGDNTLYVYDDYIVTKVTLPAAGQTDVSFVYKNTFNSRMTDPQYNPVDGHFYAGNGWSLVRYEVDADFNPSRSVPFIAGGASYAACCVNPLTQTAWLKDDASGFWHVVDLATMTLIQKVRYEGDITVCPATGQMYNPDESDPLGAYHLVRTRPMYSYQFKE